VLSRVNEFILGNYPCDTFEEAQKERDSIIDEYRDVAENAAECLKNGFDSVMTVLVLPKSMRRFFRTSNNLELLNKGLKSVPM